jgi:hypothetical protein
MEIDATAMRPDLKNSNRDLLGQLLSTTNATNSTLLTALGSNLKFIDANKNQFKQPESGFF